MQHGHPSSSNSCIRASQRSELDVAFLLPSNGINELKTPFLFRACKMNILLVVMDTSRPEKSQTVSRRRDYGYPAYRYTFLTSSTIMEFYRASGGKKWRNFQIYASWHNIICYHLFVPLIISDFI